MCKSCLTWINCKRRSFREQNSVVLRSPISEKFQKRARDESLEKILYKMSC